jgi:hypothetical protein
MQPWSMITTELRNYYKIIPTMSLSSSQADKMMKLIRDDMFLSLLLRLNLQRHQTSMLSSSSDNSDHENKNISKENKELKPSLPIPNLAFLGAGVSTRAFWFFGYKFIVRAQLVTHWQSENPIGLSFEELFPLCSLSTQTSIKGTFVKGTDYLSVLTPCKSKVPLRFVLTYQGIQKLWKLLKYSDDPLLHHEFVTILQAVMLWMFTQGKVVPFGFQKQWIPLTPEERTYALGIESTCSASMPSQDSFFYVDHYYEADRFQTPKKKKRTIFDPPSLNVSKNSTPTTDSTVSSCESSKIPVLDLSYVTPIKKQRFI